MLYYKISKLHTKENKLPFSRVEVVCKERFLAEVLGLYLIIYNMEYNKYILFALLLMLLYSDD